MNNYPCELLGTQSSRSPYNQISHILIETSKDKLGQKIIWETEKQISLFNDSF